MNAAVCRIGDVNAPKLVECKIKRIPVVTQERIWPLVSGCGGLPLTAQHEPMQSKHAHPMISGITNKQVAGANANAIRFAQLTRPATSTSKTGNDLKGTTTRIEAFELRLFVIEKVNAFIRSQRYIGGRSKSAKTAIRFKWRASAFRCKC